MSRLLTRRDFLRTAGTSLVGTALGAGRLGRLFAGELSPAARFYVGTYTGTTSKGIYQGWLDVPTGGLRTDIAANNVTNPSFLVVTPSGRFLYAVNEVEKYNGAEQGSVSAFAVNESSGALKFLNTQASGGRGPCHIALDRGGNHVFVANYTSGTAAAFPMLKDGGLAPASSIVTHHGSGPNHDRQEGPHAHCVAVSLDNRFVIVADLGIDRLMVYAFDAKNGTLTPAAHPFVEMVPGSGPRHIAFHPDGKNLYVITELTSTVVLLSYDASTGRMEPRQTVSTLPSEFHGENTAAEVCTDARGRFLYCSNRGHDSIAVFRIDPASRHLTLVQHQSSLGRNPRNFALDPSGSFLVAANQRSDSIVSFSIDGEHGKLTPAGQMMKIAQPVCIQFAGHSRMDMH